MLIALTVLLAIPVVAWQFVAHLSASLGDEPTASPQPAASDVPKQLAAAQRDLDRLRLEASQSGMPGMWREQIEEQQREVTRLRQLLKQQEGR